MVSLKKEPQMREITPVHLMDEEATVRTYRPKKTEATSTVDILVKQPDRKDLPTVKDICENKPEKKRTYSGFEAWEWIEAIMEVIVIVGIIAAILFFCLFFWGDTLQLAHDLYVG